MQSILNENMECRAFKVSGASVEDRVRMNQQNGQTNVAERGERVTLNFST